MYVFSVDMHIWNHHKPLKAVWKLCQPVNKPKQENIQHYLLLISREAAEQINAIREKEKYEWESKTAEEIYV